MESRPLEKKPEAQNFRLRMDSGFSRLRLF
jgi:hypothetical protein